MSTRRDRKRLIKTQRKAEKAKRMQSSDDHVGKSRYARKKSWMRANSSVGGELWGFQVPEPKPWK